MGTPVGRAVAAAFAVLVGVGILLADRPGSARVIIGGVVAASAVPGLLSVRERVLPLAVLTGTAGVAVLASGSSDNVGWFALCVLAGWISLRGDGRIALVFVAGDLLLFLIEALSDQDSGWFAWCGGVVFSAGSQWVLRRQLSVTAELKTAQANLAARSRDDERTRIARELHDVIGHTLTVSLMHVSAARLAITHDPDRADAALAEAERLSRASLDEVRGVVGLLADAPATARPAADGSAIATLVAEFRRAGAMVALDLTGDPSKLPAAVGLAAYRIIAESLTNAVRHAPHTPVELRLGITSSAVTIDVLNASPVATKPSAGGHGLSGMPERASLLGGTLNAGPERGSWLVHAQLPLAP